MTKIRLIDANALKEEVDKIELSLTNKRTIQGIIDNAPTVEPSYKCIAQVTLDDDKLKEYVNELAEKIKKGEFLLYDSISSDDSSESENKEE